MDSRFWESKRQLPLSLFFLSYKWRHQRMWKTCCERKIMACAEDKRSSLLSSADDSDVDDNCNNMNEKTWIMQFPWRQLWKSTGVILIRESAIRSAQPKQRVQVKMCIFFFNRNLWLLRPVGAAIWRRSIAVTPDHSSRRQLPERRQQSCCFCLTFHFFFSWQYLSIRDFN